MKTFSDLDFSSKSTLKIWSGHLTYVICTLTSWVGQAYNHLTSGQWLSMWTYPYQV